MYSVIIKNKYGSEIDLMAQKDFICIDIDGVGGADAQFSETETANIDGSIINSERVDSRTVRLAIRIINNCGKSREAIYQVALIKQYIKLILINDIRSVYIEGKVKNIDTSLFTEKQKMYIDILCPEPYFNELVEIENEFSTCEKMFYFPFAIEEKGIPFSAEHDIAIAEIVNSGEVTTGTTFILRAYGEVINPKIYNISTSEYFKINIDMIAGDEIIICTIDGYKSIELKRNNVYTNIIGKIDLSSKWLQMAVGSNKLSYVCDSGNDNLEVYVRFTNKFLGV